MNKPRLLKLAEHLESGELGHDVFDFNIYHETWYNSCATSGCAIGELPWCFPDKWKIDERKLMPILRENSDGWPEYDAQEFFNITREEYNFLFIPIQSRLSGSMLDNSATKQEVAAHIRKFVEDESYRPGLVKDEN